MPNSTSAAFSRQLFVLADLPVVAVEGREKAQVVSFYTCHRGMPKPPRQSYILLGETQEEAGNNAGDTDAAREVLIGLAEIHPGYADGFGLLAQIKLDAGQLEAAEAALNKTLAIDPDNRTAAWLRGRLDKIEKPAADSTPER